MIIFVYLHAINEISYDMIEEFNNDTFNEDDTLQSADNIDSNGVNVGSAGIFSPYVVDHTNPFSPDFLDTTNRFSPDYIDSTNQFSPDYIDSSNPFSTDYIED